MHWLAWLARALQRHEQTEFYLERVQGDWLPSLAQQRIFTAGSVLFVGLVFGLLAVLVHGRIGVVLGLIAGLFYGLGERSPSDNRRHGHVGRRCVTRSSQRWSLGWLSDWPTSRLAGNTTCPTNNGLPG